MHKNCEESKFFIICRWQNSMPQAHTHTHTQESTEKLLREFYKMAGDKIIQKSVAFLCTSNNSLENIT